ncbi:hypothetical protein C8J57DRAFT_685595 [Mycena rebaudengoi]|nr:hypothetical protein C8J57DRAFT_685595 [Mycena rebaudengoi]
MYHTAFRGMDAIDYEPDADFIDALCGNGYSSDEFEESDEYPTDEDEESLATDPDDLRNPKSFPAYKSCAPRSLYQSEDWLDSPPRHWCFLGQITKITTYRGARAAIEVEDKDEESILVTFHFDSTASFDYESLKINNTIAVLYAEQYDYPDGRVGLRLKHPQFVKIFPCPLLALLIINVNIEQETPVDSSQCCTFCQREDDPVKMSLLRCSRCLAASYCGKDCQLIDWKSSHKDECKIYKSVLELKQSRRWGDAFPRKWIAFGEKEEQEEQQSGCIYRFDSTWGSVEPAGVQKLQGCFTITSGIIPDHSPRSAVTMSYRRINLGPIGILSRRNDDHGPRSPDLSRRTIRHAPLPLPRCSQKRRVEARQSERKRRPRRGQRLLDRLPFLVRLTA